LNPSKYLSEDKGLPAVVLPTQAQVAGYPNKPIRILVPFSPGGGADLMARLVTTRMSDKLGQPFVVDNRPAAGGIVATEYVAKAAPDGQTLLMTAATFAINPSVFAKVPYDPQRDFAPVALTARSPYLLVVHPSFPARTVKELIGVAKAAPGQVNFASSGTASLPHLAGELFQLMAGVKMNHIPYKGGTPATIDTLAGQVPVIFNNMLNAAPHVKSGKMRALGVTGTQRAAILPRGVEPSAVIEIIIGPGGFTVSPPRSGIE